MICTFSLKIWIFLLLPLSWELGADIAEMQKSLSLKLKTDFWREIKIDCWHFQCIDAIGQLSGKWEDDDMNGNVVGIQSPRPDMYESPS